MTIRSVAGWLAMGVLIASCDMPHDPEATSEKVEGGVLIVGVLPAGAWGRIEDGHGLGVEPDLVRRLAEELDADVAWVQGSPEELFEALEQFRLHLVVGGLTEKSPWSRRLAFTRPYATARIEVGVRPGDPVIEDISDRQVGVPIGSAIGAMVESEGGVPVPVDALREFDGPIAAPHWQLRAWGRVPTGVVLEEEQHVWAAPPGENQWLSYVERFLDRSKARVDDRLVEAQGDMP